MFRFHLANRRLEVCAEPANVEGLLQYKIRSQLHGSGHRCLPVGNSKDDRLSIGPAVARRGDDLGAAFDAVAINDKAVEVTFADEVQRRDAVIANAEFNAVKHVSDGLFHIGIAGH